MNFEVNSRAPFGLETEKTTDPYENAKQLQLMGGTIGNNGIIKGWFTETTPSIYLDQRQRFIVSSVDEIFRKEQYNSWFNRVFPIVEWNDKTEFSVMLTANPFASIKSGPGSPTIFTTERYETMMNSQDWEAVGIQLPYFFQANAYGQKYFAWKVGMLSMALLLGGKLNIYDTIGGMTEHYLTWAIEDKTANQTFKSLSKRRKFFWNIVHRDQFALEKIDEKLTDEEVVSGMKITDEFIAHPRVDSLRRMTGNYENSIVGHYMDNNSSVQNKIESGNRAFQIKPGGSKINYQERMLIGYNVTRQPFETYSSIGEHYLFQNSKLIDPYKNSPNLRWISIHCANSDRMHRISFKEATQHAFDQLNKVTNKSDGDNKKGIAKIWGDYDGKGPVRLGSLTEHYNGKHHENLTYAVKTFHNYFLSTTGKTLHEERQLWTSNHNQKWNDQDVTYINDIISNANKAYAADNKIKYIVLPVSVSNAQRRISGGYYVARSEYGTDKDKGRSEETKKFIEHIDSIIIYYKSLVGGEIGFKLNGVEHNSVTYKFEDDNDFALLFYLALLKNEKIHVLAIGNVPTLLIMDKGFKGVNKQYGSIIEIENPALDLIKYLDEVGFYGCRDGSILDLYRLMFYIINIKGHDVPIDPKIPMNLAEKGIEYGLNIMATRSNMIYNTANMMRCLGGGRSFQRTKGRPYVMIADDNNAELHSITYRQLMGTRVVDKKSFSFARSVAVLEHITGEGMKPMTDFKMFNKEKHKISEYIEYGDIAYFFVPLEKTYYEDIAMTRSSEYKEYSISTHTNGVYDEFFSLQFDLLAYVQSIHDRSSKDIKNISKTINRIVSPGPFDYPDVDGVTKQMPGDSCWQAAKNGCNRERFGEVQLKF